MCKEYLEIEPSEEDETQLEAQEEIKEFFRASKDKVFYSRQIEVIYEHLYFHWVTKRAVDVLIENEEIITKTEPLKYSDKIKLLWHKSNRYPVRKSKKLIKLVEEFSEPAFTVAIGFQGEALVLEGFARFGFSLYGRNTNEFKGKKWIETEHDLDFIFEKDSVAYGIEVKNALGYMVKKEIDIKIELCEYLGLKPVFAVRMFPKSWIDEIWKKGGFSLIMKFQFYPLDRPVFANKIRKELGLPVDTPKALEDGTVKRFINYFHMKNV